MGNEYINFLYAKHTLFIFYCFTGCERLVGKRQSLSKPYRLLAWRSSRLVDYALPYKNGISLIKEIKCARDVPYILTFGWTEEMIKEKENTEKVDVFLQKHNAPITDRA